MDRVYSEAGRQWISKEHCADSLKDIQEEYGGYRLFTAGFRECRTTYGAQKYAPFNQKFGFYFGADFPRLSKLGSNQLKKLDSLIRDLDVFATERFSVTTCSGQVPVRKDHIIYRQDKWPRLAPILKRLDMKITKPDKVFDIGGAVRPRNLVYDTFITFEDLKNFETYSKEHAAEIIERKGRELGELYDEAAFGDNRVVTLDEHVEMGRIPPVRCLAIFRRKNGSYKVIESSPKS